MDPSHPILRGQSPSQGWGHRTLPGLDQFRPDEVLPAGAAASEHPSEDQGHFSQTALYQDSDQLFLTSQNWVTYKFLNQLVSERMKFSIMSQTTGSQAYAHISITWRSLLTHRLQDLPSGFLIQQGCEDLDRMCVSNKFPGAADL